MTASSFDPATASAATSEQLVETLRTVGKEPVRLTSGSGLSVLVLPYGGRILGLFSPESNVNFLWTHPALLDAPSACEFYHSNRWHNSGGDRTWLAPELDFFFPALPDTSIYVQPRPLDAGQYRVTTNEAEVILDTDLVLRSFRPGAELSLRVTKSVCLAEDPLRTRHAAGLGADLEFAGYRLHTSLHLLGPHPTNAWVGIWNLLQLPGGGELFAPTYYRTNPTVFFGDIPENHLHAGERMIRYRMQAPSEQKICIPALATTGRLGYLHTDGNQHVLVVRSFAADPAGAYVDVWSTKPDDDGYAVQACNINTSSLGYFAEMEYHAPAIGGDSGRDHSDDISVVWAYRGQEDAIRRAAQLLLGADL
jgi:hypothetical protein